ncbi:hypothetical protein POWCR01_000138100 [Plasmodium ovale]|uniref:PIR protein n=1 Tax=Plasmodium ovale TaxID=36330 RepID=A0A1C3KII6_PLAOA|nr:hypothetical protein POWCR01_000138100 [Plasmodium ovale]
MSGYVISECTLDEYDLQAKVFNEKWKSDTNFYELEEAALSSSKINDMKKWIKDFDGKLVTLYDLVYIDKFGHLEGKRCRDLNYYISYILHYIPKITKNPNDVEEIIRRFKTFLKAKFNTWVNFQCTLKEEVYNQKMDLIKELDDYCENKNAFKEKLEIYDKTTCCKYANHVKDRKRFFNNLISSNKVKKDDKDFHIDENCTLKNFGKTFPNVTCKETNIYENESDELQITQGHGKSTDFHDNGLYETNPGDSFTTSPTKIALTSVSTLLGACLSGLYLYRHSFVGSMLRNFQNRNHISNEDTYNDVNEMFSEGTSHYLDNLQENDRFHIAYDPINN